LPQAAVLSGVAGLGIIAAVLSLAVLQNRRLGADSASASIELGTGVVENNVKAIVMGLTVAVVAWAVLTRWPRDWVRLFVAEAIVCAAVGTLLALLVRG
jgi:uncharacterized protein HemY